MNEKLKELAVQAGLEEQTVHGDWSSLNYPDVRGADLERFAELVRQDYLRELRELKPVGAFKNKNGVWHQVEDENHPAYVNLYRLD